MPMNRLQLNIFNATLFFYYFDNENESAVIMLATPISILKYNWNGLYDHFCVFPF